MAPFRLAHFSDPHLPPPEGALGWRDFASKRLLSSIAWARKGHDHRPAVLQALVADIGAYRPDHTVLTGDLTNFATPREYAAARVWLQGLGAPADLTVSPGNHDALVGHEGEARFAPWREWLGDAPETPFPKVRERGGVAIVNLCSATATAPWLATGRLGSAQLDRLAKALQALGERGLFRILALHHPPAAGVVSKRKSLEDGEALGEVLKIRGAELVLHGHAHEPAISALPGPGGDIPALGAPSASAAAQGRHHPARWHAIEIDPGARSLRVAARGLAGESGAFEPLGAYQLQRA